MLHQQNPGRLQRDKMEMEKKKAKAVVVGGSIAGVSCAHALISAGWEVVVVEKSNGPPTGIPTGAGLSIDPLSHRIIGSWLGGQSDLLQKATVPQTIDLNQAIDQRRVSRILTRDDKFNFKAAHWADLHGLLYNALPPDLFLWGHVYLSFYISDDESSITVKAKSLQTDEVVQIEGNLLVAADGCRSSVRRSFLPDLKLKYSGFCAWRGVLDYMGNENSEIIKGLHRVYPELGNCLYFDLESGTHTVLYELGNCKINWIWYVNQPEPQLKGNSVTMKVSDEMIKNMHQEAEKIWVPEFVGLIKETKEPFINAIYDCDPLNQIFWGKVVLIGDSAHPVTPNGARSTNMSILDAAVLGKCFEKWGMENLSLALEEYQAIRFPVTSNEVLHSRRMGRLKQGLTLRDREPFNPKTAGHEESRELQHRNMPFFAATPPLIDSTMFAT